MRTTIAIDDDVLEKLREAAAKRKVSFTRLVNETLRRALAGQKPVATKRAPYRVQTFRSPFQPGVDVLHLNRVLDELEIQDAIARMKR